MLCFRRRRALVLLALTGAGVLVPAALASAHPLGNLTVNTSTNLVVAAAGVHIDHVLDLAELPAIQARQTIDANADGTESGAERDAWAAGECSRIAAQLDVSIGGRPAPLTPGVHALTFPPGQAGLDTLRLVCAFSSTVPVSARTTIGVTDRFETDRIGWREITAVGDGVTLVGSALPTTSPSSLLTSYPSAVSVPPRQLTATFTAEPGGPRLALGANGAAPAATTPPAPQSRGTDGLTQALASIVGNRDLTVGLALAAAALALLLGSLHALAPGHGKTLMAAYVVGRRGTARHVLTIGLTVAATHTAGVLALGMIIWVSQAIAPDRILPWLTLASGGLLVVAGASMLVRRLVLGQHGHVHLFSPDGAGHAHDHEAHSHDAHSHDAHSHHGHPHEGHDHPHHDDHDHLPAGALAPSGAPSRRFLVLMGIAGGLVPTPSALVVLLGATALGKPWFGVILVAVYGIGMSASLMGAGLLMVRLQSWMERQFLGKPWWQTALRFAPVVTSIVLCIGGLTIALRGATAL